MGFFFISADFVRNKLFSTNAVMNNVNVSNKEYVILFSTSHNKLEYSKIKTGLAFKLSDFVLKKRCICISKFYCLFETV